MSKKIGPLDWIKNKFLNDENHPSKDKSTYLIILLMIGGVLMLIGTFLNKEPNQVENPVFKEEAESSEAFRSNQDENHNGMKKFEEQYENQLKEALEEIVGVHSVTVVVNVESTERSVYEKNVILRNQITNEEDKEGGQREIEDQSSEDELVLIHDGEKESPVVLETRKPEVKGVLIVAGGADNIQVKKWIVEAVTRTLGVPSHRVAVMPKKTKGDA